MKLSSSIGLQLLAFLQECGLISITIQNQVQQAARESGRNPWDILIESGYVTEDEVTTTISQRMDLVRISAPSGVPDLALKGLLPTSFILNNRIFPISQTGKTLRVAIADPMALTQISNVKVVTNCLVEPVLISISEMQSLLDQLRKATPGEMGSTFEIDSGREFQSVPSSDRRTAERKTKSAESVGVTDEGQPEVIRLVNKIIFDAIEQKISDIHIEPYKNEARLRYRLDGVLIPQEAMSAALFKHYAAITTRIKIMAALDISERRLPQDGAIAIKTPDGREVDLRVSVLPTNMGERVVMRILDRSSMSMDLADLGFGTEELEYFMQGVRASQGLVLVTGPTGSGKTTTLYGALRLLNKPDLNILTAEDPVEFSISGLGQVQIHEDIGLTFAQALRSFLRQDPEVILIGEIRDKETSDIAIKAALTGHLVLSTLHTNDAIGTITRLLNMGTPGYLIGAALTTVVGQRLARKTCQKCKHVDLSINDKILSGIGFSAADASRLRTYKGKGCEHCKGTGYKGRMGIYEVLKITEKLRAAIISEADEPTLTEVALQEGFRSMQHNGREMIMGGLLSVEEYERNLMFN